MRHISIGTILTNGQGFSLYAFEADHGTMSSCSGVCATSWPPVTAANIKVTGGAAKSLVRETTRPGGARQLTYAGHPLCRFAGDGSPRQHERPGLGSIRGRLGLASTGREVTNG